MHISLQFLSDIQLVPIAEANLLRHFPNKDLTFKLPGDLDVFEFHVNDKVPDIFEKYYKIATEVPQAEKERLRSLIAKPVGNIGS